MLTWKYLWRKKYICFGCWVFKRVVEAGSFHGLKIDAETIILHLLFVDNVHIWGVGNYEELMVFKTLLSNFCQASAMDVNCQNSCFLAQNIDHSLVQILKVAFNIQFVSIDQGMKYLGFYLKPNNYWVVN